MGAQVRPSMLRRQNPGCQWIYDPSKTAIINKGWSLNVKINKVAMPQYECIISKWVSPQCKINPGKYVSDINCHFTKSSSMGGLCPSVNISESNINERSTTNHTSSDQNGSLLLKVIVVTWREYLTSSKERACLNAKKIKQGMPQQKCAQTWSCPDVSWYL